jgi:hypothetical protein
VNLHPMDELHKLRGSEVDVLKSPEHDEVQRKERVLLSKRSESGTNLCEHRRPLSGAPLGGVDPRALTVATLLFRVHANYMPISRPVNTVCFSDFS